MINCVAMITYLTHSSSFSYLINWNNTYLFGFVASIKEEALRKLISATLFYGIFHREINQIVDLIQCLAHSKKSINVIHFSPLQYQIFSEISFNYHNVSQTSISRFRTSREPGSIRGRALCIFITSVFKSCTSNSERKSFSKCSEQSLWLPGGLSLLI